MINEYILDLNSVLRINFKKLESGIIMAFVSRAKWDEDGRYGNVTIFKGELVLDLVRIYSDGDQLIRLVIDFCRELGEDFRRRIVKRLSKDVEISIQYTQGMGEYPENACSELKERLKREAGISSA